METGNWVKEKMGYLLSYEDNIQKLKDQVKRLNKIKEEINEANKKDGRSREPNVKEWLERFDKTSKDANQLCDEHQRDENYRRCGSSSWHIPDLNLKSRYQRGRKAKGLVGILNGLESHIPSSTEVNYASQKLESRNSMKEDILAALEQSSSGKTIAIYGSPGVGKSHLVSEIFKEVRDGGKLFDAVVHPSVSQSSDVEGIKGEIENQLKRELEARGKTNGSIKSVLTILDDVIWDRIDDLKSLGIPLQDDNNYKGCKLLLVSRDRCVLQDKGVDRYFKLDPLNYEESRSLFLIKASEDGLKDDDTLRNMANQVASRCEGLPLAIVTMAQLCTKKGKEGHMILNDSDFEEMEKKICSSVETSYNKLEDKAKLIFLLSVGVHEAPILLDDLLKYVIGLGVFGHEDHSINGTRKELKKTIGELKASSLLVDDHNAREVKVNALIYHTTPSIASTNYPHYLVFRSSASPLKSWPENDVLKGCVQIILKRCHIPKLPTRLDCPNLNFLYFDPINNSTLEIPESFFERMGNLQVLKLIGMIMHSLPTSLVFLTKLKTLCLHQCTLKNIAGIGALKSLEILSFFHSFLEEFLGEIMQLTYLRMLDLSYSTIEVIPPNIMSKLTKLEELYVRKVDVSAKQSFLKEILAALELLTSFTALELRISEDCISPSSKILFEKLQRFNIVIGDGWEWSDSNGTSRLLKLKLHNNIHLQAMNNLIESAEDLYLDEINGISNNDVLCELNNKGFPYTRQFHIENNTKIEHVVKSRESNQTSAAWFQNLETLILVNLSNLEALCDGPLALHSFKKLEVIKVKRCGRLKYLLPVSMIKQVSQLVEIDVYECDSMKTIVSLDSGSSYDPIEFSSLDSLILQHLNLNGLCSIPDRLPNPPLLFSNPKDPLSRMKHLKLRSVSCINHLTTLTTYDANKVVPLQNLETLEIEGCSEIRCLFNTEGFKMHETFGGLLPKMRQLCLLNLGSFKSIVNPKHPERILNFRRLNKLTLFNCKKLKNVLPLYILKNLQQLQTIDVSDCDNLERLFGDEKDKQMAGLTNETMLPLLRSLRLTNLPMLLSICSGGRHIISHSLTQMIAQNCPKFAFTFSNSKVRLQETDPLDVQNSTETIYPCLLENLDFGGLNHLKMISKYVMVSFTHLTYLKVYECDKLENLLNFRVAQKLYSLQELMIISCKNVEQILWRGAEGKASENDTVEFPKVNTLVLDNLPKLIGIFHECTIRWSALKRVRIVRCPKIERSELGTVYRPLLETLEVIQCQPWDKKDHERNIFYLFRLTDETSQLTELRINNSYKLKRYLNMKLQKSSFWQLKSLLITQCDAELSRLVSILLGQSYELEELTVGKCESLEHVFDLEDFVARDQMIPGFPNLNTIRLFDLPKLNCIWNKDPMGIVELHKLVKLEIIKCGLHKSPISPAVLEQLVLLKELKIESCQMIEHVVDDDEKLQDKVFQSLRDLQLVSLPKLMKFNSAYCNFRFPNLQSLMIEKCPKMNAFTAGFLNSQAITIDGISNDVPPNKHACPELETLKLEDLKALEVDSLSRLEKLKTLIVRNCSSHKHLKLPSNCLNMGVIEICGCNNLEGISTDAEQEKTEDNTSCGLESIVLENLPVLSSFSLGPCEDLLLKKLRIAKCPKLVTLPWNMHSTSLVLFDTKKEDSPDDVRQMKIPSNLESLELTDLPNMQLWMQEPEISVFQKLTVLKILHCTRIATLFSISVAQHLSVLKFLTLYGCENMVQVLGGGGINSKQVFQKLETLVLRKLPGLTSFCEDENVDFDKFPELRKFRMEDVPEMRTFVKKPLLTPNLKQVHVTNITKCWQGDINNTVQYLHKNHGKLKTEAWRTYQSLDRKKDTIYQSSPGNSLKDSAESSLSTTKHKTEVRN